MVCSNYIVEFPASTSRTARALLMTAVFQVEYMMETQGNDDGDD